MIQKYLMLGLAIFFGWQASAQEKLRFFLNNQEATGVAASVYGPSFLLRIEGFAGGAIYFTSDGAEPTRMSPRYSDAKTFRSSAVIRALAFNADETISQMAELNVTLLPFLKLRISGPTKFVEYSIDGGAFSSYAPGKTYMEIAGGKKVALRAVPANGWIFDRWLGPCASTNQTNIFVMDRSKEVRLSVYRTNVIEVASVGDGEVLVEPPPPYFWESRDVQITAVPHAGSYFSGWSVQKPISFNQWADTVPPSATFAPLPENTYAVSVRIDGIGTVFLPAGYKVAAGLEVKPIVSPGQGYYLNEWSGDASGKGSPSRAPYGNSVTLTMDSSKYVVAHLRNFPTKHISDFYWGWLSDPAICSNGMAVYAARILELPTNYTAVAFDRDGVVQWEVSLPVSAKENVETPLVGPDGTIYFVATNGVANGRVLALSPQGNLLWQAAAPGLDATAAVSPYGLYLSSSNNSGGGIRHFWKDGSLLEEANVGGSNSFAGLLLDSSSNPIVGGNTHASFTPDLQLRWNTGAAAAARPAAVDLRGNVIFEDLQAFNGTTGAPLWSNPYTDGQVRALGTNLVYIVENSSRRLSALDLATGQKLWTEADANSPIGLLSAVAAEDGSVFAVYKGGTSVLRRVSPGGSIIWEIPIVNPSQALLTPDGWLYLMGMAMNVGVGPARSGFPMIRGDWRNSGSAYTGISPALNSFSFAQTPQGLVLKYLPSVQGSFQLQWSQDLVQWTDLQTFSAPLSYPIPAPLETRRFYRVVAP